MSASATHATPHDDPGPPAGDTHGHGETLNDLINMGTDIARRLHGHAMAQPQPAQQANPPAHPANDAQPDPAPVPAPSPTPDALIRIAAAFGQTARDVRRCIALKQHLNHPKQQQPARLSAQQAPDRTTARKRIIRAVEDVIQRPPDNDECDDAETLLADLRERMDAPDLDDDIATRPPEDIIKEILRDLGLAALPGSRPWKRCTQADIADLNASAAAPSRPARSAGASPQNGRPVPNPEPDQREHGRPATPARPPTRPGDILPKDPAEAVAFVLHHHARTDARWRPPPGD